MINQDRLRLMTKMAAYEADEGKKNMAVASDFRSDYMGLQIIKSVICATLAYLIIFGLFIYYDFETYMQGIYKMDLMAFGKIVDKCSDGEKKKIYNLLIEEVQIFDREQEDGRWLKSIKFRFPIYYNNDLVDTICWDENPSVESVCLLSKEP